VIVDFEDNRMSAFRAVYDLGFPDVVTIVFADLDFVFGATLWTGYLFGTVAHCLIRSSFCFFIFPYSIV